MIRIGVGFDANFLFFFLIGQYHCPETEPDSRRPGQHAGQHLV